MSSSKYGARRRGQEGLTLIGVLVLVAITAIMLAKASESWESILQREREEELIFRGEEYKEAIEKFYMTHRRLPAKLEELIKMEPRSIRKLYLDPFDPEKEWVLIHSDAMGRRTTPEGDKPELLGSEASPSGESAEPESGPSRSRVNYSMPGKASKQQLKGGFIIGVSCASGATTFRAYGGSNNAADWEFVADISSMLPKQKRGRKAGARRGGRKGRGSSSGKVGGARGSRRGAGRAGRGSRSGRGTRGGTAGRP